MNYGRILLAAVGGTVVFFIYGFLVFGLLMKSSYRPYAALYRPADVMKRYMALGFACTFIAVLVLALIYAKGYGGHGIEDCARFGLLIGVFVACAFVGHNYVTLNIGGRFALYQAAATVVEWMLVVMTIGVIYRTAGPVIYG